MNQPGQNLKGEAMKQNYTHMILVLDESGSMAYTAAATREGVNGLLDTQQAVPGDLTTALYKFSNSVSEVATLLALTTDNYRPSGGTALNDAVCQAIDKEGARLSALPEEQRPDKVVVAIVTDGFENASIKFKKADVKDRITRQEAQYQWQFVFLGANMDAFAEAESYGILKTSGYAFNMTADSIKTSYDVTSKAFADYRVGTKKTVNMADAAKDLGK
jgi:Mg-chelatase subunit ChlD